MSNRLTQTKPDTEQGGGQDRLREAHPQPSPGTHLPEKTNPTRNFGKPLQVESPPPKIYEHVEEK